MEPIHLDTEEAQGHSTSSSSSSSFELRDYQQAAVDAVLTKWALFGRLLGVAPTGSGKTIEFAHLAFQRIAAGPVLILADRDELLGQARDKIGRAVGLCAELEKGEERASLESDIVVASVQSLSRPAPWSGSLGIISGPRLWTKLTAPWVNRICEFLTISRTRKCSESPRHRIGAIAAL